MSKEELLQSVSTALIDGKIESSVQLQPKLIFNEYASGSNMLSALAKELHTCEAFYFAVAFITQSGLITLKEIFRELEQKGISGYILTTDYLCFSQPKALYELMQFRNLQVRIYTKENFHVKGYIFKQREYYSILVGSSNLTQTALKLNKEWNMKLHSYRDGDLIFKMRNEFAKMWQNATVLNEAWLDSYKKTYKAVHLLRHQMEQHLESNLSATAKFVPNKMQVEALAAIEKLRTAGEKKALLVSATGTGKTYLSAFAVKQAKVKRLLFLVHREQILKQATTTFNNVLRDKMQSENINIGLLSSNDKDFTANYLFSTVSMMSKADIYTRFAPTYFDYIIIDETHRAGAESYKKILAYFKPQFLLGMTATPERTDGFDIYALFDYNIAYEIRLQQAMEENLLCPFHYFGVSDICVNGREIDDDSAFSDLTIDARVEHIIAKSQFYGYSGERIKGLVFCRSIEEAYALSEKFNDRGFNTEALCGKDSAKNRETAVSRLEQRERKGGLDYIFTVDIMNEGIDIPAVNQIIMLRPTKSAIIFVQQMGRGLRKYPDKEYVVILDFIGNYRNNFMIPIALSGDISYNKDTIRRYIFEGNRFLAGCSTINFDEISRKKIYAAIDTAKLSETALLKNEYFNLKQKLGKIPRIEDFERFSAVDILKFMDKFGSYHHFLQKYDKDYRIKLNAVQEEMLVFICRRFAKGKRLYELLLLQYMIDNKVRNLFTRLQINLSPIEKQSVINNLTNQFTIANEQAKYAHCVFIQPMRKNSDWEVHENFFRELQAAEFKQMLAEIINFAMRQYHKYYTDSYQQTNLVLYRKYTYEEVCYLLNWRQKINPNAMAGYFYEKVTHTLPVFINYIKPDSKRVDYANEFIGNSMITAYSKSNRKLDSTDARHIYDAQKECNKLYLFVRRNDKDKDAKEFYFLGEITAQGKPEYAPKYNGFKILYKLLTPVREDIFDYLMS